MDFAGPILGKMFLVIVDAFSKWLEVALMNEATSQATVSSLRRVFATHGLPQVTVTDNGPAFIGQEFTTFMKKNGVKVINSAPYHPASNGQAERMVRTFKEALKSLKLGDLQTKLNRLLYKYRITPHSATGRSPAEMMFKRELRTPFHLLQPGNREKHGNKELKDRTRSFEEGTKVWAKNFGQGEKWIPGVVNKKLGNVTYEISFEDKDISNRHIDHLTERKDGDGNVRVVPQEAKASLEVEVKVGPGTSKVNENLRTPKPFSCTNTPEPPVTATSRRSSRVPKEPAWKTDFVSK